MLARVVRYFLRKVNEKGQAYVFSDGKSPEVIKLRSVLNQLSDRRPKRIFVIGNGPSLAKQDLELLKGEFTICSNAFFHAYADISWKPTILTVEDPLPAEDNAEFYNTDCESLKIIPYDLRRIIRPGDTTCYVNFKRSYRHSSSRRWPEFSNDISTVAYWGGTVSFLALQIAATFRPDRIILLGTDLSYVIPDSAKVSGTIITSTEDDPNHFNPAYFGAGKRWHVPETERMQRAFDHAFTVLLAQKIEFLNATEGGNLKHVPRVGFEGLFN